MNTQEKVELYQPEPVEPPDNKTLLYVVSENRPRELSRLLQSVALSTYTPAFVCVISPNTDKNDWWSVAYAAAILREKGVRVNFIECDPSTGLSARKNIALSYAELFECTLALAVDDDMVLEYHALEDMVAAMMQNPELFGVGPVVLHTGRTGLPKTPETWQTTMVDVVDGTWVWGGHRQGVIPQPDDPPIVPVEHLAGVYLHRVQNGERYDIAYDRPVFFLYDSDFLYRKNLAVVRTAIAHHWPTTTGVNLQDSYAANMNHILLNAKYFVQKHGIGTIEDMSWEGYTLPTNTIRQKVSP